MISIESITKIYPPDVLALDDVSFGIAEGEFLLMAGKSGAGKTTLLKLILAEETPTRGEIFLGGQNIHRIRKENLPFIRRKIGAVFQDYRLLPSKTVYENVAFILEAIEAEDDEIEDSVTRVLKIVGLENKANKFPQELSSGENQRAAIARALIHRPDIILADEPTGNLDPYNTSDVIKLFLRINQLGTTLILATHNKDIIKKLKKRTILLKEGKLARDDERGGVIF